MAVVILNTSIDLLGPWLTFQRNKRNKRQWPIRRRFPLLVFFLTCFRFQRPFLSVSGAVMTGVTSQQYRDTSRVLTLVRRLRAPVATATGASSISSIPSCVFWQIVGFGYLLFLDGVVGVGMVASPQHRDASSWLTIDHCQPAFPPPGRPDDVCQ